MDSDALIAVIGVGLALVTCVGGLIVRDRAVLAIISAGDKAVRDETHSEVRNLHERINKTRDEFVRRDDLDTHMKRLEDLHKLVYDEQRRTNDRLDGFIAALAQNGTGHPIK